MRAMLWPVLGHFAWVMMLYVWLTVARYQAVRSGRVNYPSFEFGREEPPDVARITRNLANQFEAPILFYATILLLMQFGAVRWWDVAFAWLFLAGRVVHTAVQTLTSDVPLRGRVFMINFIGIVGLIAHLVLLACGLTN